MQDVEQGEGLDVACLRFDLRGEGLFWGGGKVVEDYSEEEGEPEEGGC